ncbi:MAG: beta-lactamase family protein [Ignavibacteria bacterium]|nr:beta-lactamase family protein [Ignavibacteria bacterium]
MQELGWCTANLDTLIRYLERNETKAFLVLKDGKMVIEWYPEPRTKDSIWYWASAGKTVTSVLVGIAQQEGFLSITDKSSKYLGSGWTSLSQEQEDRITVWNQLTMTSGLNDLGSDPYCTLPTCLVYLANAGTRWAYHNAPYTLLDKVIENATGDALNVYYDKKLKSTTGMDGLFIKSGYNNVLVTTPRAMARFGLLALGGFAWDGVAVVSDTAYARASVSRSQELNLSYGYLWWLNGQPSFMLPTVQIIFPGPIVPSAPPDSYFGLGKNSQILSIVPSENLVVVRMGNAPNPDGPDVPTNFVNEMWALLRGVICTVSSFDETVEQQTETRLMVNSDTAIPINARYSVYDLLGNCVIWESVNSTDFSSLPKSVYVVTTLR